MKNSLKKDHKQKNSQAPLGAGITLCSSRSAGDKPWTGLPEGRARPGHLACDGSRERQTHEGRQPPSLALCARPPSLWGPADTGPSSSCTAGAGFWKSLLVETRSGDRGAAFAQRPCSSTRALQTGSLLPLGNRPSGPVRTSQAAAGPPPASSCPWRLLVSLADGIHPGRTQQLGTISRRHLASPRSRTPTPSPESFQGPAEKAVLPVTNSQVKSENLLGVASSHALWPRTVGRRSTPMASGSEGLCLRGQAGLALGLGWSSLTPARRFELVPPAECLYVNPGSGFWTSKCAMI